MFHSLLKTSQISLLISLFMLNSCITIPPPSYKYSREVARFFETPILLKNHTYYYLGSPVKPDSIIAIDNQFTMTTKVWSKVDINQKMLDDWAFWLNTYLGMWSCPYRGAILFAPDGRQVGVGYSRLTFTVVKMPGPDEIVVYPPQALGSCKKLEAFDAP